MKSLWALSLMILLSPPVIAKELLIGVEQFDYFPISAVKNDHYVGYSRDLLDAFAKQYYHTLVFKPYTVKSLFGAFKSGKVDFKFPDNPNWAMDFKKGLDITYSAAALTSIDGVMVLPKNRGQFQLKRLGTIMGFTRSAFSEQINKGAITRHEHENIAGLIKLIKEDLIDGIYSNIFVTRHFLKGSKYAANFVVFDNTLDYQETDFSLSSISKPEVILQFNEFLKDNRAWVKKLKIQHGLMP